MTQRMAETRVCRDRKILFETELLQTAERGFIAGDHRADSGTEVASHCNAVPQHPIA
jgi:hypothetical protein